jgi:hypothetical protein
MIVLYVALGLVVLFVIALVVMAQMGKRMSPDHTHVCSIILPGVKPEDAWRLAYDCAGWPAWAGVDRVDILKEGREPTWRMKMGRNSMLCQTKAPREFDSLEVHVEDERAKIFTGVWLYRFSDAPVGGTRLELTENGTIHAALPRYMARRLFDPKMYLKRHLRKMAGRFGVGAEIEEGCAASAVGPTSTP